MKRDARAAVGLLALVLGVLASIAMVYVGIWGDTRWIATGVVSFLLCFALILLIGALYG